ncbi:MULTISPECIES: hypothetical protein [unclassified Leptolyngbya]|uniref:hypothetical protein n=1 Tax=unclassified Leptolyngbya TaxID=2650499 RepID=UPI001687B1B8|nr:MULTISPECIES: hypothetical protein [unclassified Leptolyngbya]MBD1914128.1 hypothetical protein [Leptolyngbya sp. FACHB-8]MBD2158719.1 hypothetical protein [Leptolyngbya sp. FACHB-16]
MASSRPSPVRSLLTSMVLLMSAYSVLSWFLYRITAPRFVWILVAVFALFQALLLTTFSRGFRTFLKNWLESDLGYFSVVMVAAFSVTLALMWYHVFEYFVLVAAAEVLARLDLQNAGLNQWQALLFMTLTSALGLAVGWSARQAIEEAILHLGWFA